MVRHLRGDLIRMLRPTDSAGGVDGDHLADSKPVEEHAESGQLDLDRRRFKAKSDGRGDECLGEILMSTCAIDMLSSIRLWAGCAGIFARVEQGIDIARAMKHANDLDSISQWTVKDHVRANRKTTPGRRRAHRVRDQDEDAPQAGDIVRRSYRVRDRQRTGCRARYRARFRRGRVRRGLS